MNSKKLTQILLAVYLFALTWIILLKLEISFSTLPHLRSINLIPFTDLLIVNGAADLRDFFDNILAFIPFGIFTGLLSENKSFINKIAPIFLVSLAFEAIQFIFSIGASDINDLIANTLGGIIGIGIYVILSKIFKKDTQKIINYICLTGAVVLILFTGALVLVNL